MARHRTAKTRASHALVSKVSRSGTTPHGKNESIASAGIESKLVLSGMIIQHTPPPDTAVELCMPCQALSTSVRHNARGARDAAQVATPRSIERFVPMFQCSDAKLGEVTWRGVSGMGSLDLDR